MALITVPPVYRLLAVALIYRAAGIPASGVQRVNHVVYHLAYRLNINFLQDIYMHETFKYTFILISYFLILFCKYLELLKTIFDANSAFTLGYYYYYYYYYYFGCVLSSLLIYVDRLYDFMFVLNYGSSSGRAVGPTFKLGSTRISVRLEYSRRSSIDDKIGYIYIV